LFLLVTIKLKFYKNLSSTIVVYIKKSIIVNLVNVYLSAL
jgi:hypothetical protein